MRNHNSQYIGFYTETLVRIYLDTVSAILPQNEIARDIEEIRNRALNEGMNFFTKVLPSLGKSIDVSLANGSVANFLFSGFKKKQDTNLPRFMNKLFAMLFRSDGMPRFATWYSDIFELYKSGDVDMTRVMTRNDDYYKWFIREEASPLERVADIIVHRLGSAQALEVLSKGEFPGLSFLYEVGVGQETINHISIGELEVCEPLLSDEELNSRREALVVALRSLRQVCFCFYKLELPYTREQQSKVLEDFVSVDSAIDFKVETLNPVNKIIHKQAWRIIRRVLSNADPRSGIPRHGPGAVATGEKLPEKHVFKRDYRRLTAVFGLDEWFFCNLSHVCDSFQELQALETLEVGTAKVVLVPKDSRGPRLISCEPLEYQWIQQSLMRVLVDTIEDHSWTKGQVNFIDQSINRELALKGSKSYDKVTLDMKEASDRVSLELVKSLVPELWWEHLYASRTASTELPCGRIVPLNKFAPMGSAVCFPVEALVFWALSVAAINVRRGLPLRKAATKVHVYGDDIICDAEYRGDISNTLPDFGLLLNKDKCCVAGPFTESCGMDAFLGHPVTPTKIRSTWCDYPEPSMLASYVEYSNAFYRRGMFETAEFLEAEVQWILRSHRMSAIPTVSGENPSCIAFVRQHERAIPKNRALGCKIRKCRSNPLLPDYQVHEVQGYRLESKPQMAKTYGWPFLLRKLTELEAKNRHLQTEDVIGACSMLTGQYPIAHRVRLKRAWTPLT